jgi:capsular exopolysaccharide synthesis family protein
VDTTEQLQTETGEHLSEGMSIKELLHILRVRVGWIIGAFIIVMIIAVFYLQYVTPMYESQVSILVESLSKSSSIEDLLTGQSTTKISTEVELALSDRNITEALAMLNLSQYRNPDGESYENRRILGNLKERVTVSTVKDTNIVKITVTDANPRFAADFANALAESYNELLGSIARNSKTVQKEFIQSQIPINETKLQQAADALGAFREESNIIQLSDKSTLLSEKIAYFQLRREPLTLQLNEAIYLYDQLFKALESDSVQTPTYEELLTDVEIKELAASLTEKYRELVLYEAIKNGDNSSTPRQFVLDSSISQTSKALLDRFSILILQAQQDRSDAITNINRFDLAKAAQQRLVTSVEIEVLTIVEDSYSIELSQLPVLERRLVDLQREVQVYETLRLRLLELLEEMKIAEAAISRSVTVVDAAKVAVQPVSPNKMLIMAVALLLGVALGILLALFVEMLDITIKDEGTIKRIIGSSLPILGWIPLMNFDQKLDIPELTVINKPLSFEAERYKLIASNISYGTLRKTHQVFSITSPGMGEGKTSAIANIGTALAQNGMKILLVDGDLRLPQLETFFDLKKSRHGLVDVIWGKRSPEEVIIQPISEVPSLHIMPPGLLPPLPSAVFNSAPYASLLQYLAKRYDYILIDTPPLAFASELMAIAKHADGLVINIRAGVTTKGALRELLDNLTLGNINVLGIIFNGVIENRSGGHYTGGRYYAYKDNYYAKRYYQGREGTPTTGSTKGHRYPQRRENAVRGGYRANFLRDLKRREKARGEGRRAPMYPFILQSDPFQSQSKQPGVQQTATNRKIEGKEDLLATIENDPKARGRQ